MQTEFTCWKKDETSSSLKKLLWIKTEEKRTDYNQVLSLSITELFVSTERLRMAVNSQWGNIGRTKVR